MQKWETLAPMLHKRGNHALAQLKGCIYVMGGGLHGSHFNFAEV